MLIINISNNISNSNIEIHFFLDVRKPSHGGLCFWWMISLIFLVFVLAALMKSEPVSF